MIAALPTPGHVYPVMALAEALRARGERVTLATGGALAPRLEALGWDVAPVTADVGAAVGQVMRDSPHLRAAGPEEAWQVASAMFGDILPRQIAPQVEGLLGELAPDLLVYEEMSMGAALAAARHGTPAVRHGVGPYMEQRMLDRCMQTLPEVPGRSGYEVLGQAHLDIWPSSLADPEVDLPLPRLPMRPQAWADPEQPLPGWLQVGTRERPVVYLTLGTVTGDAVPVLRAVLEGLGRLDVEVLAAVGSAQAVEELSPVPPTVHLEVSVPGAAVFPRVDAVVHHGGSGTLLGALAVGLPQLVLPQRAHDQFPNARLMVDRGAGTTLLPEDLTADAVTEAVRPLLEDEHHRRCAHLLADEIASMPDPYAVVDDLQALTA
jgi:UDP:flavonoid glycosyltransferase YjiC (YdhE family)